MKKSLLVIAALALIQGISHAKIVWGDAIQRPNTQLIIWGEAIQRPTAQLIIWGE